MQNIDLTPFYNNYNQIKVDKTISDSPQTPKLSVSEPQYIEGWRVERITGDPARDRKLRSAAIKFHGKRCKACGFDFEIVYGVYGADFIEVHHKYPLSKLNQKTKINPAKDLTVVCSNCHSMIHKNPKKHLSISELRKMLRSNNLD